MKQPIYLDHQATTPVDPRVLEAMLPWFSEHFGNAASRNHAFGWRAEEGVEQARDRIARCFGALAREIVFTSGATESNNLALKGLARLFRDKKNQIVTVATEHPCVLDSCKALEREGVEVTYLPVDSTGQVDPDRISAAISDQTFLVSVMAANNEIGVLQPIEAIGALCRQRKVLFHTDAAQGFGKIPIDVDRACIDLMSLSAHKIYGPKGVGALYLRSGRPRVRLVPQIDGGGHERGLRSGTLNVPGIIGFARAAELCIAEMEEESNRLLALRERLWTGLEEGIGGIGLNGHRQQRLAGNLNVSFEGVDADALIPAMADLAVSSGSACASASLEPSHVLQAIGLSPELSRGSIRFGLGRFTTEAEVDHAISVVCETVKRLRLPGDGRHQYNA